MRRRRCRAQVEPLRLDAALSMRERNFDGHLQAYHDRTGLLTREQVASPDYAQRFETLPGAFNGGYARGAWWVRFRIEASPEQVARPLEERLVAAAQCALCRLPRRLVARCRGRRERGLHASRARRHARGFEARAALVDPGDAPARSARYAAALGLGAARG
ncbi:7TM-DISM domain-containing protein [Variovorax sp. UC122_21]|uniref:7TM-DISM domain-containing protein n=1 Tax=Variovorax sp. UC122_21 TaxID=3374554 RepID=UPI0037571034